MIRKTLTAILLAAMAVAAAPAASAQQTVGDWNLYSLFNGNDVGNIVDTKDKVFMLTAGRLYAVDKGSNETYAYTTRNKLNDTNITQIYPDPEGKQLLIAYDTGNIDLLDIEQDRVTNMGDIMDATLTTSKAISCVWFTPERIYVGTDFGLVVFDAKGHHVVESGIYNSQVDAVMVNNGKLYIHLPKDKPRYAPVDARHNTLDAFQTFGAAINANFMAPADEDNFIFYDTAAKSFKHWKYNWEHGWVEAATDLGLATSQPVRMRQDGSFDVVTATELVNVKPDCSMTRTTLPAPIAGQKISAYEGPASIWAINADGYANYSVSGDGQVTVLADKARPVAITASKVAYIVGSKNGEKIYISNLGASRYKSVGDGTGTHIRQTTDVLTNGIPADASVHNARMVKTEDINFQKKNNNTAMYGGCQRLVVDPTNPNRYFLANYIEGVFVVEDNKEVGRFTVDNMPSYSFWNPAGTGAMSTDVNFDPEGNLWVGCWVYKAPDYSKVSPYTVLPREKVQGDLSKVTKDDWMMSKHRGVDIGNQDMGSVFSSISPMMFTWHGADGNPLSVTDTKGTYANTADDVFQEYLNLTDQDGKSFKPSRWICAREDKRGRIWFGTTSGVVEIANPAKAMDADFHITRIKVPRNDGTNFADYLLESEQINDIAVDASNRKWIATENSGVYLVSENGDKILEHYTPQNSGLPSNAVYAVYCDPNSNVVYFGLGTGLISYNSTSSPAAEDFSDVYAYPNPVRPDYTGWITVKGLKDNSLVKIADSAGNVLYQTRSEGGMVVWDGCNADGKRVRSGVYFVYASASDGDSTTGAVTKIMVIN